jgi:hypothetical protein
MATISPDLTQDKPLRALLSESDSMARWGVDDADVDPFPEVVQDGECLGGKAGR